MPPLPTGFPATDAQDDFTRARRRQAIRRLGRRFERGGADIDVIPPVDEVVGAIGRVGERDLGLQLVERDPIVAVRSRGRGSVYARMIPAITVLPLVLTQTSLQGPLPPLVQS